MIILSSLLLISFLPMKVFSAEEATLEPGESENQNQPEAGEKPVSYLFFGNSKTYYNNLPEMFKNIVFAGTGEEIECTSITYSGRTEEEHGKAVRAQST